ncbi:amidase family protein [Nostocoides australiense]
MTSGSRRSSPGRPDLVRPRSLSQDLEELRAGRIEAGDRLRSVCDRVAAVDRVVHALVVVAGRRGRVLAEADRPGDWSGRGVGVGVVIRVDALPTTAGSSLPVAELAGPQASVARLRAAGASVVGKTVSAEFAVAAPGPTTNPYDRERTPGGSSSGSAAAVASGAVPLALGTQTIGSVVRPPAYCGVVGFKPSFDRVGLDGVIPNAPSLDTLGWFTATIADAALAAELFDPRCRGCRAGSAARAGYPVAGVSRARRCRRSGGLREPGRAAPSSGPHDSAERIVRRGRGGRAPATWLAMTEPTPSTATTTSP